MGRTLLLGVVLMGVLVLSACSNAPSSSTNSFSPATKTPTPEVSATAQGTALGTTTPGNLSPAVVGSTPTGGGFHVKIYFSKKSAADSGTNAVYPVDRVSPTSAVGGFAIHQLIVGPTAREKSKGYYSELSTNISGSSNCASASGDLDFQLMLNRRGEKAAPGVATVKFCRSLTSAGIGTDARMKAEIENTLKQFPTIKDVIILTQGGSCLGDESGMNRCLS